MTVQQDHSTRRFEFEGGNLGYPSYFRDGSAAMGLFVVPASAANALIADSGFEVARIAPGRTIFSLSCVHYDDSDCGVYEEIALSFFVKKMGQGKRLPYISTLLDIQRGNIASYTWRLPVTTQLALDAGKYMWGLPKTIEEIDYENADGQATFTWRDGDKEVLSYSVAAQGTRQPATMSPPVYSIFEGSPHVSYLTQTYRDTGIQFRGGELQLGNHPIADELRSLGLPKRPLISTWNGHLYFQMSAPQQL
ncbi:MAG: acetoacetate decarboxylase family protein [Chloroflexi bacterium]|nr:acetoacetate decarboxylase family protein [Chloroflexota bacterium]